MVVVVLVWNGLKMFSTISIDMLLLLLGWYYGERIRDNERGWFPANHTVEIQNAHVRARNLRHQFLLQRHISGGMSSIATTSQLSFDRSTNTLKGSLTAPSSSHA